MTQRVRIYSERESAMQKREVFRLSMVFSAVVSVVLIIAGSLGIIDTRASIMWALILFVPITFALLPLVDHHLEKGRLEAEETRNRRMNR